MAPGPRQKVLISNILPASRRKELKFSLKIAFLFVAIILKCQGTVAQKGHRFLKIMPSFFEKYSGVLCKSNCSVQK